MEGNAMQRRRGARPGQGAQAALAPGEGRVAQGAPAEQGRPEAAVDCGWGRLLFAQTFENAAESKALKVVLTAD